MLASRGLCAELMYAIGILQREASAFGLLNTTGDKACINLRIAATAILESSLIAVIDNRKMDVKIEFAADEILDNIYLD